MRTLALGDVHGAAPALEQVLVRAQYDPYQDTIIFLGDAVDGWPNSRQVLDIFLQLRKFVWVRGNHDEWFYGWASGSEPAREEWLGQGGLATVNSYRTYPGQKLADIHVPREHIDLLGKSVPWYEDETHNRIFVHGGWYSRMYSHPSMDTRDNLMWDRSLWERARDKQLNFDHYANHDGQGDRPNTPVTNFTEVYVGHTATNRFSLTPVRACEVWNLDQGAGWEGKLSLMDVDTKQYWQSDLVKAFYRGVQSR